MSMWGVDRKERNYWNIWEIKMPRRDMVLKKRHTEKGAFLPL